MSLIAPWHKPTGGNARSLAFSSSLQNQPNNRIRPFVAFLYPLFFTSGIPALLYQVVWQRSLFTIYGTSTESATAVVAAFLLGLGLGAFAGGWAASRWPTRLLII
jgi:spermidine synthase